MIYKKPIDLGLGIVNIRQRILLGIFGDVDGVKSLINPLLSPKHKKAIPIKLSRAAVFVSAPEHLSDTITRRGSSPFTSSKESGHYTVSIKIIGRVYQTA